MSIEDRLAALNIVLKLNEFRTTARAVEAGGFALEAPALGFNPSPDDLHVTLLETIEEVEQFVHDLIQANQRWIEENVK